MWSGAEVSLYTAKDLASARYAQRFAAVSPTPGSGITGHAQPQSFDETKPFFALFNSNPVGGADIFPSQLHFTVSVISTGGTGSKYTHVSDAGNRVQTAATSLIPVCMHTGAGGRTGALITVGAVVATAPTTGRRIIADTVPRGAVIENVWDEYTWTWGSTDAALAAGANTSASAQTSVSFRLPPVCIAPQTSYLVYQWKASQTTGPTLIVNFDYIEA